MRGSLVLDMSQFLSGPFAALRLGDLGARVIKIERPDGGDLCRRLYLTDTEIGGDSTLFHAINRGKLGFAADFKNPADVAAVKQLDRQGRRDHPELPPRRRRTARARLRERESDQPAHRLRLDHRLWRGRPVGDAAGPGPARAGALRPHVAERRPRPGAGAVRPRHRRSACGRRDRAGRARRARAARPDRGGRAYRDEPPRGAGRFPVRGAHDLSQRRRPHADALGVPQRARLSRRALRRLRDPRRLGSPSP